MYQIETVKVDRSQMEVFVFTPDGDGPHPGLVLAQHIPIGHTGIENDTFTLETAARFCKHGYTVAVPFIFHWWPKDAGIEVKREQSRDDWMVADIKAAFNLLSQMPSVDKNRIGIVGHCWGGRVAWLGACHISHLKACAMFYGGGIKIARGEGNPTPIQLADRIHCPVAGFFGNDDENPSPDDVNDYAAALEAAGAVHEFHRYDAAGHAFQNFPNPEHYRETQSEDAWVKVLTFLDGLLK